VLSQPTQRGISLVEAMVVLVVTGILMAVAAPAFSNWIAGSRIRATAESMLAALQYTRTEATTRNTQIRFQFTSTLGADCQRVNGATNWVIDVVDADASTDSVEGQCNATPDDTTAPGILQLRSGTESGTGTNVTADASQIVFNGLGRQAAVAPATTPAQVTIDVTSARGQCAAAGGDITCLRILVSPAGQVRMCNPKIAAGDPQAC